jgi:hypothetical protein
MTIVLFATTERIETGTQNEKESTTNDCFDVVDAMHTKVKTESSSLRCSTIKGTSITTNGKDIH